MGIEYYDESQGKPVNALEETTVLDDTSVFLTTYEEISRKINFLNLIRAMTGDETSENPEYRFYNVKTMTEKISAIRQLVGDNQSLIDEFNETMRDLTNSMQYTIKQINAQFLTLKDEISGEIAGVETRLLEQIQTLTERDDNLEKEIHRVETSLSGEITTLRETLTTKVDSIIESITTSGDIAEGLATHLAAEITRIDIKIDDYYNELVSQDSYILGLINQLGENVANVTENIYSKDETDQLLQDIYSRIKVEVISADKDENGNQWDLNNVDYDSLIFWNRSSYPLNLPPNVVNGLCITINCVHTVKQIFIRFGTAGVNDHNTFVRSKVGSSWSEWVKYLTSKDITYGTDIPTVLDNGQIYFQYYV